MSKAASATVARNENPAANLPGVAIFPNVRDRSSGNPGSMLNIVANRKAENVTR